MTTRLKSAIIFAVALSSHLWAQPADPAAALKKKYGGNAALYVAFDLDVYWSVREKHEKKDGELTVVPGDKFRLRMGSWEWVCDGRTYWQYNKKTAQVIISDLKKTDLDMHPSRLIRTCLGYDFILQSRSGSEAVLVWNAPGRAKKTFTAITLYADMEKNLLRRMVVVDTKETVSTYTFLKTRTGGTYQDGTFTFTVPKGVEVIDDRD
jgi:chaperone LolA